MKIELMKKYFNEFLKLNENSIIKELKIADEIMDKQTFKDLPNTFWNIFVDNILGKKFNKSYLFDYIFNFLDSIFIEDEESKYINDILKAELDTFIKNNGVELNYY